jgi:hypothetical protein
VTQYEPGVERTVPALEIHKVQAFLQFDEHGLQPYWGAVSAFEPDHSDTLEPFEALGCEWRVEISNLWHGKIEHPEGRFDEGLYEYQYQLVADDETGDRDATLYFRPGYPRATHVETGELIQGFPTDSPECLRVQAETVNVDPGDLLELLRAFFSAVGLNPDYIGQPNDWSRITGFEGYIRVDRSKSEAHLTGEGGLIQQLAQLGSTEGNKGRYRWDHEKVQGQYEAVALDRDTWEMLLPRQAFEKRLKSYHPRHVRSEDPDEDPLYHPKLEVQLWSDEQPPVPWDDRDAIYDEFLQTAANALHWSGIGLDADSDSFVEDPYHDVDWSDQPVEIVPNPVDELVEAIKTDARDYLLNPEVTPAEFDVVQAATDGGASHYRELAELAGVSVSTVYRAVKRFPIIEADRGRIDFPDQVTRERVATLIERFKKVTDGVRRNLRDAVQGFGRLTNGDGDPSALKRWMDAHGAVLASHVDEFHFRFDDEFTEHEIVEILRSGYKHAVQSGLKDLYRDALVTYRTRDGDRRKRWKVINPRNGRDNILGRWPLRA